MEVLTFEAIVKDPTLLRPFRVEDTVTLSCTGCQAQVQKRKKDIVDSITKKRKGSFCTPKCSRNYLAKDSVFILPCKTCQKEVRRTSSTLLGNAFCSRSCAASFNNQGKRRHPPRTCTSCSKSYVTSKAHQSMTLCIECKSNRNSMETAKSSTIAEYTARDSVKNKHPSWKASHVRILNRSWNKDLTKMKCQVCTYDKHVELAHIRAVSDFPEDALLGEVNHPDNILVLCRNHHWEFDHGLLKLEEIPQREKSIQAVVA